MSPEFTSCIDRISETNSNICNVCGSRRTTEQAEASLTRPASETWTNSTVLDYITVRRNIRVEGVSLLLLLPDPRRRFFTIVCHVAVAIRQCVTTVIFPQLRHRWFHTLGSDNHKKPHQTKDCDKRLFSLQQQLLQLATFVYIKAMMKTLMHHRGFSSL